jgi:hypothetical protein
VRYEDDIYLPDLLVIYNQAILASTKRLAISPAPSMICSCELLDQESLDFVLQASDLVHQITSFVRRNTGSNNGSANTAGTTQSSLTWNINVRDVLED